MFQKLKIPIIIVATVILTQGAGYAVRAAMPDALLASGTSRYAAAYATSPQVTSLAAYSDMPGMTKYVSIPSGKTADVIVIFCGDVATTLNTGLQLRATIRDVPMAPDPVTLLYSDGAISNQCAMFQKTNVTAGSPPVKIQWAADGAGPVQVNTRSLFVILNIH
jgi:hypothetical protein